MVPSRPFDGQRISFCLLSENRHIQVEVSTSPPPPTGPLLSLSPSDKTDSATFFLTPAIPRVEETGEEGSKKKDAYRCSSFDL